MGVSRDQRRRSDRRAAGLCVACGLIQVASGWCADCRAAKRRYRAHGRMPALSDEQRFDAKVKRGDGCWEWVGAISSSGYGSFWANHAPILPHRWSYHQTIGPIPEGMEIDHLCLNRACVRPDHLEAVTHGENARRGTCHWILTASPQLNKAKTHCPRGHEYTTENTRRCRSGLDPRGGRSCRTCHSMLDRARRKAKQ
jgi:hypothetical protein